MMGSTIILGNSTGTDLERKGNLYTWQVCSRPSLLILRDYSRSGIAGEAHCKLRGTRA